MFKAGDIVWCKDESCSDNELKEGQVYTIEQIGIGPDQGLVFIKMNGALEGFFASRFELVDPTVPAFKPGDRVQCIVPSAVFNRYDTYVDQAVSLVDGEQWLHVEGKRCHASNFRLAETTKEVGSVENKPVTSFNTGDKVRCIKPTVNSNDLTKGWIYTVEDVGCTGEVSVKPNGFFWWADRFELVQPTREDLEKELADKQKELDEIKAKLDKLPKKYVRYVNVYGGRISEEAFVNRANADYGQSGRTGCIRIEWTDGQFDD